MNKLKFYEYKYIDLPRITKWVVNDILEALRSGVSELKTTLDLGISEALVRIYSEYIDIGGFRISPVLFNDIKEDRVYEIVDDNDLVEIIIKRRGVYKLKPVAKNEAPTLEINGIHMHRIKGITPWMDSMLKVKAARVKRGHRVLDTCMGLGYTAIHSIRSGAAEVYTVEVDENVIEIARHNPWSQWLSDKRIKIIHGDVIEVVTCFEDNFFDRVIHDPPRFSHTTGDLYGLEFYRELYRVLKPGGILYHYTGEPGRHGGPKIVKGIGERLRKAGFIVKYDRVTQGFKAYKYVI